MILEFAVRRLGGLFLAAVFVASGAADAAGLHPCPHHAALPGHVSMLMEAPSSIDMHAADPADAKPSEDGAPAQADGTDQEGQSGPNHCDGPCTCVGCCTQGELRAVTTLPIPGIAEDVIVVHHVSGPRVDLPILGPRHAPHELPLPNPPPAPA